MEYLDKYSAHPCAGKALRPWASVMMCGRNLESHIVSANAEKIFERMETEQHLITASINGQNPDPTRYLSLSILSACGDLESPWQYISGWVYEGISKEP